MHAISRGGAEGAFPAACIYTQVEGPAPEGTGGKSANAGAAGEDEDEDEDDDYGDVRPRK